MKLNSIKIPVAVSNRHIHLKEEDLFSLFGSGFKLTKKRDLFQIEQFASEETITVLGPKGKLEKVRIVGPTRHYTQLEISKTDAINLGIDPPMSYAGKASKPAEVILIGPKGEIKKFCTVIAMRHIHYSLEDSKKYGLKDGDLVSVKISGDRGVTFHNVVIRVDGKFVTELHLDTDEANSAGIFNGVVGEILKNK